MDVYACALLWRDGKILLGKRALHRRAYPGCWDVIGGRVENGETLEEALTRELGEELGITPTSVEKFCEVHDSNPGARGHAIYSLFVVTAWSGAEPSTRNSEHSALQWFTIEEACALADLAPVGYPEYFRRLTR